MRFTHIGYINLCKKVKPASGRVKGFCVDLLVDISVCVESAFIRVLMRREK
jgi:hypothetical protein